MPPYPEYVSRAWAVGVRDNSIYVCSFEIWQDGTQVAHFTSGVTQTRKPDGYTKQVTVNGHIIGSCLGYASAAPTTPPGGGAMISLSAKH